MPHLTRDLPGIGGVLKGTPEDFRVDELPLYEPSGEGDWLLVRIEKRGMTTHEAVQRLARALHVPEREVGYAGIKDARAVATQWLSLPASCEPALATLDQPWLAVKETARHSLRLRVGELAGNRFEIVVRDVDAEALGRARAIVAILARRGVPNFFGAQRFGTKGDSDAIGRALCRDDCAEALACFLGRPSPLENDPRIRAARQAFDEGRIADAAAGFPSRLRTEAIVAKGFLDTGDPFRALMKIPRRLRLLFLSAWQSRLFNRCLEARFATFDRALEGDVIVRHETDRAYETRDVARDQARIDAFEISPAGPLFGPGILRTRGAAAAIEEPLFAAEAIALDHRRQPFPDLHLRGERRAYRFPLRGAAVDPLPPAPDGRHALRLRFDLPRSCYATCVLDEVMKGGTIGAPLAVAPAPPSEADDGDDDE